MQDRLIDQLGTSFFGRCAMLCRLAAHLSEGILCLSNFRCQEVQTHLGIVERLSLLCLLAVR